MFKVHFPATSYLKKSTTFFGTNHFLSVLRAPIKKSAGLVFFGRRFHEPHSWAPTDAGISDNPDEHDHPPWNHDPKTGELLEGGLHPIDFVARDLSQRFKLPPEEAMDIIQGAIDRYNRKHDENSNHALPNADSPQWRKVVVGPYYEDSEPTHMRRVRGAEPKTEGEPRPLITYSYNRGNVGVEGGASGRWIDAGFIHMNKELGEELEARGVSPAIVKDLKYVDYHRLLPGSLSGGVVQSIGTQDWKKYQQTGILPDRYLSPEMQQSMQEQRMHPEVHAHQLAELMPNDAFRMMGAGGRGAGAGFSGEDLQGMFNQLGLEHELSPEQLNQVARSAMIRLLFQKKSHNLNSDSGGGVGAVFRPIIRNLGSHHNEETYRLHAQHAAGAKTDEKTPFARSANIQSAKMVAHLSHAASKLMNQGMSQEDALNTVLTQLRASDSESKVSDEYRDMVQGVINKLLGASGHEKFSFGDIPTDEETHGLSMPGIEMGHHEAPEHWHGNIIMGEHELAPIGSSVREGGDLGGVGEGMGGAPAPVAPQPAPAPAPVPVRAPVPVADPSQRLLTDPRFLQAPPAPMPRPAYPMRQANPLEMAYQQMLGGLPAREPTQTFFDIGSTALVRPDPALIQRSQDVASSIDAIKKKIGYFDGFLRGEN